MVRSSLFLYPVVPPHLITPVAGALIKAQESHGGYNQAWLIKPISKGSDTYTIRNLAGGTYISVGKIPPRYDGDHQFISRSPATRLDGKPVFAWEINGLDNQHWIIRKSGSDWWKYVTSLTCSRNAQLTHCFTRIQNKSAGGNRPSPSWFTELTARSFPSFFRPLRRVGIY